MIADDDDRTVRAGPRVQLRELARGFNVDHFIILGRLGVGGHGSVYAAWDSQLGRRVALKVLHDGVGVSEEDRARMVREARALAQLAHDNVVRVYALGELDGTPYVVMEYVEGRALDVLLKARSVSAQEVIRIFKAAGHGLSAVHRLGIVHRDIKPANILVGADGRVCIGDFGLAVARHETPMSSESQHVLEAPTSSTVDLTPADMILTSTDGNGPHDALPPHLSIDDLPLTGSVTPSMAVGLASLDEVVTLAGSVAGTPSYMAPEQLRGEALDVRCDQFAFCLSFWRALWGTDPFGRFHSAESRLEAFTRPPDLPRTYTGVAKVLLRGLALARNERFADMQALLDALDDARARPRRLAVAAASTGLVAALICGGWMIIPEADPCDVHARAVRVMTDTDRALLTPPPNVTRNDSTHNAAIGGAAAHLDAWLAHWESAAMRACAAPPSDAQDAVMECLDRRIDEAQALVAVLRTRGVTAWSDAMPAVVSLLPPQACALATTTERREALGAQALQLQQQLHRAHATWTTGKSSEARTLAEAVILEARAQLLEDIESEAQLVVGRAAFDQGDIARAEDALRASIALSMKTRRLHTEANAWIELVRLVGDRARRFDEAARLVPLMHAAAARVGDDHDVLGRAALAEALTWNGLSDVQHALMAIQEAVRLAQLRIPVDPRSLSRALMVRGVIEFNLSDARAALASMDEAQQVLEGSFPEGHVAMAAVHNNRGYMLRDVGRLDEAEASFHRAAAIFESYGTDHAPSLGVTLLNLIHVAHDRGQLQDARALAMRALDLFHRSLGANHDQSARALDALVQLDLDEGHFQAATERLTEIERVRAISRPREVALLDARTSAALLLVEQQGRKASEHAMALIDAVDVRTSDILTETLRAAVARAVLALLTEDWVAFARFSAEAKRQHAKLPSYVTGEMIRTIELLAEAQTTNTHDLAVRAAVQTRCLSLPRDVALARVLKMACGVERRASRQPQRDIVDIP